MQVILLGRKVILPFLWMLSQARGYAPYMGALQGLYIIFYRAGLWITREKLWISGENWGELVLFALWLPRPHPPHLGGDRARSPSELMVLWDGVKQRSLPGVIPRKPGDRIME
jgi:hypothetical protein